MDDGEARARRIWAAAQEKSVVDLAFAVHEVVARQDIDHVAAALAYVLGMLEAGRKEPNFHVLVAAVATLGEDVMRKRQAVLAEQGRPN